MTARNAWLNVLKSWLTWLVPVLVTWGISAEVRLQVASAKVESLSGVAAAVAVNEALRVERDKQMERLDAKLQRILDALP